MERLVAMTTQQSFFGQDSTKIVISGAASTRKPCSPKEVANFQNTLIRNLDGIYVVTKLKNKKRTMC